MPLSNPPIVHPLDILHVDDDPMNLRVVEEILGAFGHRATRAASGAEALGQLAVRPFDLMLLDIHMPRMGGIEVLQRLRAGDGPESQTPVIALTADVFSLRGEEYRTLGFDGFVSKPILVRALLDAIVEVCGGDGDDNVTAVGGQCFAQGKALRLVGG